MPFKVVDAKKELNNFLETNMVMNDEYKSGTWCHGCIHYKETREENECELTGGMYFKPKGCNLKDTGYIHYKNVKGMVVDAKVSIENFGSFALGIDGKCVIEMYNWGEIIVLNEFEFAYDMVKYDVRELEPLC